MYLYVQCKFIFKTILASTCIIEEVKTTGIYIKQCFFVTGSANILIYGKMVDVLLWNMILITVLSHDCW